MVRNAFYINTPILLHSPIPLTFPLLYNNDIIINLYKLHFSSYPFSLQPNKKVFHPSTFPFLQPNTHEGKPNFFYPPTNFPSSHFSTPPTKRTLKHIFFMSKFVLLKRINWKQKSESCFQIISSKSSESAKPIMLCRQRKTSEFEQFQCKNFKTSR